jgi:hypothetical protein
VDHRRTTRPAERRTAASITSVRDRVCEPGRAGRGVIEELGVHRRGARRVSPVKKLRRTCFGVCGWRLSGVCRRGSAAFPATVDEEPVMGGEVVA